MSVENFVGRDDAVKRLHDVLTGHKAADGKLTVQSIEGPGGIGKTFLFNHAIAGVDLSDRNYLILRTDGNEPSAGTLVRAVARMVDGAQADAIRDRASGYFFPFVDRVVKAIETIRAEAVAEFQQRHPNNEDGRLALLRFLDLAIEAGKRINDAVPITKKHVNCRELEKAKRLIEETVPRDGQPARRRRGPGSGWGSVALLRCETRSRKTPADRWPTPWFLTYPRSSRNTDLWIG